MLMSVREQFLDASEVVYSTAYTEVVLNNQTAASPSNGLHIYMHVVVNNKKCNGATTGSGGCREFRCLQGRFLVDCGRVRGPRQRWVGAHGRRAWNGL